MLGYLRAEPRIAEAFRTGEGVGGTSTPTTSSSVRRVLPARLRHRPRAELDPGAGRGRGEADGRGPRRGHRLRPGLVVGADRRGLPAQHGRRLGLPPGVDRAGPQEGRRGGRRRPGQLRGRHRADLLRHRLRPRCHLRLPARHGRPARRRPPRPRGAGPGRHVAGGRAERRRHRRRQLQPGGPAVLQRLAVPLRAERAVAAGGYALGAQAGEAAVREIATEAGFTRFRRAAESAFNVVYEIRP